MENADQFRYGSGGVLIDEGMALQFLRSGLRVLFTTKRIRVEAAIQHMRNSCERPGGVPVKIRGSWILRTDGRGGILFVTAQTLDRAIKGQTFDRLCGWVLD
ncbi:MAG: hypothetical protein VXX79_18460, partial [Pseudomonadota bacterium]|nr:hypothetical protein [Pseudomonadota bacterium]